MKNLPFFTKLKVLQTFGYLVSDKSLLIVYQRSLDVAKPILPTFSYPFIKNKLNTG